MRSRIIFAMVCFVAGSALGQNQQEIDSLVSALETASQEDSIQLYHDLAIQWYYSDRNKSLEYNALECKSSRQLADSVQILKSQRLKGQILRHWKEYDSAEVVLLPLVSMAKRLSRNDELLYLCMSLGAVNLYTGRYDKAIKFYSEALNLPEIEKEDQQEIKTVILFNTGVLYYKIRDNDRALEYDFITLDRLRNLGDPRGEIPQILANISLCYIFKHDFSTGEQYLKQAQAESGNKGSEHFKMQMLFNYGMLFQEQQKLDEAERFLLKSYPMAINLNDIRFQLDHIERLSSLYIIQNRFKEAKQLLAKAHAILATHLFNSEAEKIYWLDTRLYKATGDVQQLAIYQEKYVQTHDSVYNTNLRVNLARAEAEHQKRLTACELKSSEELILLKDSLISWQRVVIFLALITAVSVTLMLIMSIRRSRSRQNANLLLEEKVKERMSNYSSALSELKTELRSQRELINKFQSETANAMTAIGVLSSLGKDDPENRTIYFEDIKKVSLKVLNQVALASSEKVGDSLGSDTKH